MISCHLPIGVFRVLVTTGASLVVPFHIQPKPLKGWWEMWMIVQSMRNLSFCICFSTFCIISLEIYVLHLLRLFIFCLWLICLKFKFKIFKLDFWKSYLEKFKKFKLDFWKSYLEKFKIFKLDFWKSYLEKLKILS